MAALALGAGAASAQELKIGFLAPMTGPFSQIGKDMENGFQMYLDEQKGNFAGAKVTFIVEDEEGKPPVGVRKAEKLAPGQRAHAGRRAPRLTGYAIAPVSTAPKTVYVLSIAAADDLTQRDIDKFPYIVRIELDQLAAAPSARQVGLRERVQDGRRHRRRLCLRPRGLRRIPEGVRGLRRARVQKIWPPLGTKDFGPYIPTIKRDADAIFSSWSGRWRCSS